MAALYSPGIFVGLAQGLAMALCSSGRDGGRHRTCRLASGAVVFSQFFWPAALQQLTGPVVDGTWVPVARVHFAAVTGALLAGRMADDFLPRGGHGRTRNH
jgi:hypothetical protein